jgi:hypothetical protein
MYCGEQPAKSSKKYPPLLSRTLDWSTALNSGQFTNQNLLRVLSGLRRRGSISVIFFGTSIPHQNSIELVQYGADMNADN